MSQQLADLLFPDVTESIENIRARYPARPVGQNVVRFAPSPTGFLHIGGVYTALVSDRFVHQDGQRGVMMLRIEDTDQKRQMEDGIGNIIRGLHYFGIDMDEGPLGPMGVDGYPASVGAYGPYVQSQRRDLYRAFIKHLVAEGKAYPCWMTEQQVEDTRTMQQAAKKIPGIYGEYAIWRDVDFVAQQAQVVSGQPYVIRLRAPNVLGDKITFFDEIKGESTAQANFIDHVLLKASDGLPTYHMAHLVDDHLMWTTHVIRSDEWFASLPFHLQLFASLDIPAPKYAHIAPFLAIDADTGNKRKLSKRKDKEADVRWFGRQGISANALLTYIMNIVDPSFEEWAAKNPDKTYRDFSFKLEHMNQSGALFDMQKLFFISKEELAAMDKETFAARALAWAKEPGSMLADSPMGDLQKAAGTTLVEQMEAQPLYTFSALNIERCTEADPKRYRMFSDITTQLPAFYDAFYDVMEMPPLPESCTDVPRMQRFVDEYLAAVDLTGGKDAWFAQLKDIGGLHGFAASNADFKQFGPWGSELWEWESPKYVGKIGELAMWLRMKLLKSSTTPDLYESMWVLGKERIERRLRG